MEEVMDEVSWMDVKYRDDALDALIYGYDAALLCEYINVAYVSIYNNISIYQCIVYINI